jgi:hypothetical protein
MIVQKGKQQKQIHFGKSFYPFLDYKKIRSNISV